PDQFGQSWRSLQIVRHHGGGREVGGRLADWRGGDDGGRRGRRRGRLSGLWIRGLSVGVRGGGGLVRFGSRGVGLLGGFHLHESRNFLCCYLLFVTTCAKS